MRILALCCAILGVATLMAQTPDPHQGGGNSGSARMVQPYEKPASFLGVGLADVNSQRARDLGLDEAKGTEVIQVEPGSPAAKAGLRPGDVLLTYNGENVLGAAQLGRLVRETPPDRKLKIQLWRDGRQSVVTVLTEPLKQDVFTMPDIPNLTMSDLPSAMLMWKSGILGIYCESVDSQLGEYFGVKEGVLVRFVVSGSAAQRAGLKAGDVLTKVADRTVASPRDVTIALHLHALPDKPVLIVFTRDRKEMSLKVSLDGVSPLYDKLAPTSNN